MTRISGTGSTNIFRVISDGAANLSNGPIKMPQCRQEPEMAVEIRWIFSPGFPAGDARTIVIGHPDATLCRIDSAEFGLILMVDRHE